MKEYYIEADTLPKDNTRPPTPKPIKEEECEENKEIVNRLDERIVELRYQLDHTNPDPTRSISLQEHLYELTRLKEKLK